MNEYKKKEWQELNLGAGSTNNITNTSTDSPTPKTVPTVTFDEVDKADKKY